ncbi:MAG: hypothetical protein K9N46_12315 [Candidatus Marinimicrobia bacterium]|nr:hypothetical protein [Candidatus Neomarinimicrobiota bacterium]MCF7829086.1 hypothetical protein [Candidatus Neomarinimicrobiota bacterium]MCF7881515.1 hypothetical protein [Candidatus Neomarinimicrobiota bacterium]
MKKITLTLFIVLIAGNLSAQNQNYHASGLAFLQVNPDSRLTALGGAGVGLSAANGHTGPGNFLINPAVYQESIRSTVQAGHSFWLADAGIEFLGVVFPVGSWNTGISMTSANIDGFELRDHRATDEPLGEFGAHYLRAGLHASTILTPELSVGARMDFLYEKIYYEMASGGSISLGAQYRLSDDLTLGATINHLGVMSELRSESTPLPTSARIGVGITSEIPEVNIDYNILVDGGTYLGDYFFVVGGYELWYRDLLALRGGVQFLPSGFTPSLGAGIRWGNLSFDYGILLPEHQMGTPHQLSLHLRL